MGDTWRITPFRVGVNPDMVGVESADPSCGAAIVAITNYIPPPGSKLVLQINTPSTGGVVFTHIVTQGNTPVSIAAEFSEQINKNVTLQGVHVAAMWTVGTNAFGITNLVTNLVTVSAQSFPEVFALQQGSAAWDAGPILFLERIVPGVTPLPGSNMGQIIWGGGYSDNPNVPNTQYATDACNVLSSIAGNLHAERAFYTVSPTGLPIKRARFTDDGGGGTLFSLNDPNGADIAQNVWYPYNPSVRSAVGNFGAVAATGLFARAGNTVMFQARIEIIKNGSAGVSVIMGLPYPGTGDYLVFPGRASGISGKMLQCMVGSPSEAVIVDYNNAYPGQNGETLIVSGMYPTKIN